MCIRDRQEWAEERYLGLKIIEAQGKKSIFSNWQFFAPENQGNYRLDPKFRWYEYTMAGLSNNVYYGPCQWFVGEKWSKKCPVPILLKQRIIPKDFTYIFHPWLIDFWEFKGTGKFSNAGLGFLERQFQNATSPEDIFYIMAISEKFLFSSPFHPWKISNSDLSYFSEYEIKFIRNSPTSRQYENKFERNFIVLQ